MLKRISRILSLLLCASLLLITAACGKKTEDAAAGEATSEPAVSYVYSATLRAASETKVIPSGKGQVLECGYEVGDRVNAGALLYKLDDNGLSDSIKTTENSIAKARISVQTAQENVDNLKVYSPADGILHDFSVKQGERVNSSKIGSIYDERGVRAIVPFNEAQTAKISVGDSAEVMSSDMLSSLPGTVKRIYDAKNTSHTGAVLYDVEIAIANAGSFHKGMEVTAKVSTASGSVTSPTVGAIDNEEAVSVVSRASGNALGVYARDGERVKKGQLLLEVENSNTTASLRRARLDLDDLNIKLAAARKDYEDLFVYAPASGVITVKNKGVRDNITSTSDSVMIISDTSSYLASAYVADEVITKIKPGDSVSAGADTQAALEADVISADEVTNEVTLRVKGAEGLSSGMMISVDFGRAMQ